MLPRSLTKRIFLAFAALGIAMLVAVSASLFVVLRDAHQDDIKKSLGYEVVVVEASLLANPVSDQTGFEGRIKNLTGSIVDDGGFVLVQGPRGAVRVVAGNPSSATMPAPPPAGVKNAIGTLKTSDGKRYVYIEPNVDGRHRRLRSSSSPMPDQLEPRQALSDLLRTHPAR
jgi:hypothetical protein